MELFGFRVGGPTAQGPRTEGLGNGARRVGRGWAEGEHERMHTDLHDEIAHGLRTPLTSVLGYTATLLDQWDSLDEGQRLMFARIVYGEALRMSHTVEHLDRQLYREFAAEDARSGWFKQGPFLADAS
jgi:signal transduction histidine kinase